MHQTHLLPVVPVLAELLATELQVSHQLELLVAPVVQAEQELEAMELIQLVEAAPAPAELVLQVVVPVLEWVQLALAPPELGKVLQALEQAQ